ncbi:hypothetical protein K438DRAFT_1966589 [Mycena galopus ATCC 62051]|nr:hypothetical protein K438DRAFT_1966589 [Mycena galopus ATCC 62051]
MSLIRSGVLPSAELHYTHSSLATPRRTPLLAAAIPVPLGRGGSIPGHSPSCPLSILRVHISHSGAPQVDSTILAAAMLVAFAFGEIRVYALQPSVLHSSSTQGGQEQSGSVITPSAPLMGMLESVARSSRVVDDKVETKARTQLR